MLPIKLSNSNSNFLTFLFVILFFCSSSFGEEKTVDIWDKKNDKKSEENKKKDTPKEEPKIDISKINQSKKEQIQISDSQNENPPIKLVGLYDPGKNDLSLEMWSGTNGELIRDSIKRIEKIKLSKFSEEIFLNTILTYSYPPKKKLVRKRIFKTKNKLVNKK